MLILTNFRTVHRISFFVAGVQRRTQFKNKVMVAKNKRFAGRNNVCVIL